MQPPTTSPKARSSSTRVSSGTDAPWGAAGGAPPEGTVLTRTSPESGVPSAASGNAVGVSGQGPSVTAATASAATAAATTAECAGLPGGADHRERRELPGDVGRAALRAGNHLIPPDELLEVLLALHADVLVHRHRSGSLRAPPDGRQIPSTGP